MKNTVRKTPAERKAELLDIGAKLASKHGYKNVTRRMVAKVAGVTEPLVSNYLGGTDKAQAAYARRARALKLPMPDKAKAEEIGAKLRSKKPRAAAKAPAKKAAATSSRAGGAKTPAKRAAKVSTGKAGAAKKSATSSTRAKPKSAASATANPSRKRSIKEVAAIKDKAAGKRTAARAPKAPPSNPVEGNSTLVPIPPLPAIES